MATLARSIDTPAISIQDVGKQFVTSSGESVQALAGVNLEIGAGEFLSILGPSGCGKSTLLRIIDGLIEADTGSVTIAGEPVRGPGPDRAMVFQNFALLPWLSVVENIMFPLEVRRIPKDRRRELAEQALATVGLSAFAKHYPRTLSGGMQQRVGLARALAVEPAILLMDEPFGALDALTRATLQDELLTVWSRDRKTAVFVTHAIDEAVYLSDRVAVMSAHPGQVMEVVEIPLDRNREASIRDEPEFAEIVTNLRHMLHSPGVGTPR